MVGQHLAAYGSVTKTSEMVGQQVDVRCTTLRRWVVQADVDDGQRDDVPPATLEELAAFKAVAREPRGFVPRIDVLRGGTRRPQLRLTGFIDASVVDGFAVESICTVLTSEGC